MDHGNTMPYIVDKMNIVINPMENGSCRTLKNQYQQSGPSNFQRQGTFGATGVINTEKVLTEERNGISSLSRAEQSRAEQSRAEQSSLIYVRQATKKGIIEMEIPGIADLSYPDSQFRRGRVQEKGKICPTLMTEAIPSVLEDWVWEIDGELYLIRIRKLTPKECWRLMSFTDRDFGKAEEVMSNSSLYKQAGNSIVTDVLCAIFKEML